MSDQFPDLDLDSAAGGGDRGPEFQPLILDDAYIAYERDVGDIDGDGDNDLVAIQEGTPRCRSSARRTWKRSTLVEFAGTDRYPRADDLKLADIDKDGDLDVVTRLGNAPTSDAAGIAVWCENLGGGANSPSTSSARASNT